MPVPNQNEDVADAWPHHEAFGRIYQEHSRAVYYLVLRFLCDAHRAEDATHDVFLKAYRNWNSFRGEASVKTWLYRIAINHCKNLLESWHDRHIRTAEQDDFGALAAPESDSPLRILEIRELGQRIEDTLAALPPDYRLILLLVADEELSYQQVAQLTGQTSDAVRGKLHRARKAFAAAFERANPGSGHSRWIPTEPIRSEGSPDASPGSGPPCHAT